MSLETITFGLPILALEQGHLCVCCRKISRASLRFHEGVTGAIQLGLHQQQNGDAAGLSLMILSESLNS